MSSSKKRRQQKIPYGSCLRKEVVNPPMTSGAPSFLPARDRNDTCSNGNILLEHVVERNNMFRALHRVEQNKGASGIDGMGVRELRPYLKEHWQEIKEQLLNGTYQPLPVRRVEIPKPDGRGVRMLGIPPVIDRMIQQALLQVLTPLFDPGFSDCSYGFRPGRRAHDAVKRARCYIEEGYEYVVDMDLEKFFDRVNHDMLMSRVSRKVKDRRILRLIRRYLEAGVMINGVCVRSEEGTPQGGPLSPLLANIMLDDLDKELESRGVHFVRYADDQNIYVRSLRAGERVYESVVRFVESRLKLKVNSAKSAVDRPWKRKFLGFSFTSKKPTRIRLAPETLQRFRDRIRTLTKRSQGISLEERIRRLNEYVRGWFGYFRLAETPSILKIQDEWIRRRLRACLLKQWKLPRTRKRKLMSLGVPERFAAMISGSSKGIWKLSRTIPVQQALGLAYWRCHGLFSLTENYRIYCQSL